MPLTSGVTKFPAGSVLSGATRVAPGTGEAPLNFLAVPAAGVVPGLNGGGMIPARAAGCAANRAPRENFAHPVTIFALDMWLMSMREVCEVR